MFDVICTICRESLSARNYSTICALPCGHIFHESCIFCWLQRSQTCPHCRVATTSDRVFKLYFEVFCEENNPEDPNCLKMELLKAKKSAESIQAALKRKGEDMINLTRRFNELNKSNAALRNEAKQQTAKIKELRTLVSDYEHLKKEHNKAVIVLQKDKQKSENLEKELIKYQRMKKLLEGSVKESTEALNDKTLDLETLKVCFSTVKRDFNAAVESETKLKADYSKLFSTYKKMEKSNVELNEKISIKDRIIESYKKELIDAAKKLKTDEKSPRSLRNWEEETGSPSISAPESSSDQLMTESTGEPTPKKRLILPVRKSSRESLRSSAGASEILKRKPAKSQLTYNGLGGHSKEDKFPSARLKPCKIVSNRKTKF